MGYIGIYINGEYMNNLYWICSYFYKKKIIERIIKLVKLSY